VIAVERGALIALIKWAQSMPVGMGPEHETLSDAYDALEHCIIFDVGPVDPEVRAAYYAAHGPLTPGTRPCNNEQEPDGVLCTGTLTFALGDVQAKCPACGGWMGRLAPGHERAVTPAGSNPGGAS